MTGAPILSRLVPVDAIGPQATTRALEATDTERAAIAASLDMPEVAGLRAEFSVRRSGAGLILVEGRVKADIVQRCVVSLAPVRQSIDEPVVRKFFEAGSAVRTAARPAEGEFLPGDDDPPENLDAASIDLGAIALEHFLLAIDPYPRAPGAVVPAESPPVAGRADSPFAVLERLKKGKPGQQ